MSLRTRLALIFIVATLAPLGATVWVVSILLDQSFKYHNKHVVSDGASCSVCHDPHGITNGNVINNSHLIDFDLAIVAPSSSHVLRYESAGTRSGTCYLTCHGKDHNPLSYR